MKTRNEMINQVKNAIALLESKTVYISADYHGITYCDSTPARAYGKDIEWFRAWQVCGEVEDGKN